jgi:hypothetical protein
MKRSMILFLVFASSVLHAIPTTNTVKKMSVIDDVPLERVATLLPADAKNQPHLLFVNVKQALPPETFKKAAAYIAMKYNWRIAVQDGTSSHAEEIAKDSASFRTAFGSNAVLVVEVVLDKKASSYLNVPGWYSQVNVQGLDKGDPDAIFQYKRVCQMLMKGLAQACGIGATLDDMCVMSYRSFTVEGMDEVSATYGPNAFFSMTSIFGIMVKDRLTLY